jgi:hypothetical protein
MAAITKAAYAPSFVPSWRAWATGFGGTETTDGNAAVGSSNVTSSIYGVAAGADYRIAPGWTRALRWLAAAAISRSLAAATAAPIWFRPAASCATPRDRPISPSRRPMACNPSQPRVPLATTGCRRSSIPTRFRRGSRAVGVGSRRSAASASRPLRRRRSPPPCCRARPILT